MNNTATTSASTSLPTHRENLLFKLVELRTTIMAQANQRLAHYQYLAPMPAGAENLAHYLAFRSHDLRPLQNQLADLGLTSLGRIEAHVLPSLERVICTLAMLCNRMDMVNFPANTAAEFVETSEKILRDNGEKLFGIHHRQRQTRIMVTLSTEAAASYDLVRSLIERGMDCARINCAHDSPEHWQSMANHVRRASEETGINCHILMDLAGHKLRTGNILPAPAVHHFKIPRNRYGHRTGQAEVLIERQDRLEHPQDTGKLRRIGIPSSLFNQLEKGDRIAFTDCRGKKRFLEILHPIAGHWKAVCHKSAYLGNGATAKLQRLDRKGHYTTLEQCQLVIPADELSTIRLRRDDLFQLSGSKHIGQPAEYDDKGKLVTFPNISCSIDHLEQILSAGDPVWIDDGKLGAVVESVDGSTVLLKVTEAAPEGVIIKPDKGLNFPGVELGLGCLSSKDEQDLDFVCQHADMVGFSFVESAADMQALRTQLQKRDCGTLPIIAKIETNQAVRNLPEIILSTIGQQPLGIMIARGDLAVELGNARLAEIQEELLWLCDAAHIPVIWATQVLESMAKKGVRSRPEFTDAAASVGAECVMLNKGRFIPEVIETLDDVLLRMEAHQHKRFSRLRALHW